MLLSFLSPDAFLSVVAFGMGQGQGYKLLEVAYARNYSYQLSRMGINCV